MLLLSTRDFLDPDLGVTLLLIKLFAGVVSSSATLGPGDLTVPGVALRAEDLTIGGVAVPDDPASLGVIGDLTLRFVASVGMSGFAGCAFLSLSGILVGVLFGPRCFDAISGGRLTSCAFESSSCHTAKECPSNCLGECGARFRLFRREWSEIAEDAEPRGRARYRYLSSSFKTTLSRKRLATLAELGQECEEWYALPLSLLDKHIGRQAGLQNLPWALP